MTTTALAIRHMYSGSMFNIGKALDQHGISHRTVEGFTTDLSKIDALEPDILIVMGGSMGVYEADLYPYLKHEIDIIRKRVEADRPTLGICLGSQLMAAAMGKRVYKGPQGKEIGFREIQLTQAGQESPLHHFDPSKTRIMQIHGDTFDLPDEATLLASSPLYTNQAYRIGRNCFALQFHPELDQAAFENLLVEKNGVVDVSTFRAEAHQYLATLEKQTALFMADLLKLWRAEPYA
jgi:GMP synthase (glutamine-hydrolysing)